MGDRRRKRRGFFFIIGWRVCAHRDGTDPQRANCPNCREESWMTSKLRRRWFTLFFLPVLPLDSAENAERITECGSCKAVFDRPIEQIARIAGRAPQHDWQESIALYNKLRDNPADSSLLQELLECYEAMNEPNEAISVARHFPVALQNSPACQTILARLRGSSDSNDPTPQPA